MQTKTLLFEMFVPNFTQNAYLTYCFIDNSMYKEKKTYQVQGNHAITLDSAVTLLLQEMGKLKRTLPD